MIHCYLNSSTIICFVIRNDIIVPEVLSGVFHLIKQLTHVIESLTYTTAKPEKRLMDLYLWSASNHYLFYSKHIYISYISRLSHTRRGRYIEAIAF
jgi:hypothetical protein